MEIKLHLELWKVNKLCKICDSSHFDINVVSGKFCVDGRSVMGVMRMCGRDIEIVPITTDLENIEKLYERLKPLGAVMLRRK